MRALGIDYGDARIGIALSDPLFFTAQAFEVIDRKKVADPILRVASIVSEQEVSVIVIGLPVNMNGSMGTRVEQTRAFASELAKAVDVPIEWIDERLTTVSAEKLLIQSDVRRDKRKKVIDKIAAALILQTYLESKGRTRHDG
ncbi:MAG: Holliday junction resolvase RuvX [Acidibacillus sp.]|uniref:Putative pre-16S rRNA nuclease n=1 Tax=Sulfoacidibacillus ferrooxidans TaxID=2005001 RepID=A0A9X1V6K6_9BACL|nr:Holliday junction resolvase RuvX [Sulfoacidibacillus ferrooxidans]MCI0181924.1 putative pre-16S rRNA nuclease [Sulfoacidibacillus ferrooxidans]MCY0892780.1 Holliday junction resolvase RuvX [Acidibacillus sp.]